MAAERVFNKKLGQYERLLAFDRYWQGYDMQGGGRLLKWNNCIGMRLDPRNGKINSRVKKT